MPSADSVSVSATIVPSEPIDPTMEVTPGSTLPAALLPTVPSVPAPVPLPPAVPAPPLPPPAPILVPPLPLPPLETVPVPPLLFYHRNRASSAATSSNSCDIERITRGRSQTGGSRRQSIPVPTRLILSPLKVAIPLTALTVAVPANTAPPVPVPPSYNQGDDCYSQWSRYSHWHLLRLPPALSRKQPPLCYLYPAGY